MDVTDNPATPYDFPFGGPHKMRMDPERAASPAFRRWFDGSVVTWPDGSPRVMYHGGKKGDIFKFRSHRASQQIAGFFAFDPKFASSFAAAHGESGATVYPVVLSLRKVFDVRNRDDQIEVGVLYPQQNTDSFGDSVIPGPTRMSARARWQMLQPDERLEIIREHKLFYDYVDMEDINVVRTLQRAGFDGYLDFEIGSNNEPTGIAVFDPRNIKSVLNVGTWKWSLGAGIRNPRQVPREFPWAWAEQLRTQHPDIWRAGGNVRGNDTYRLWTRRRQGERTAAIDHWWDVERPAWHARHRANHRLAGVVAQIKWGVVGDLGVDGMKRVVLEAINRA